MVVDQNGPVLKRNVKTFRKEYNMFPVMTELPSSHIWSDSLRTPKEKLP